jgi:glycerol-3-phosphate dehydrogenase
MKYTIENEMCVHPSDYFIRRTSSLYFHRPELLEKYESLYPFFAQMLGYTEEQKREYNYEFLREVDEALDFTENSN